MKKEFFMIFLDNTILINQNASLFNKSEILFFAYQIYRVRITQPNDELI